MELGVKVERIEGLPVMWEEAPESITQGVEEASKAEIPELAAEAARCAVGGDEVLARRFRASSSAVVKGFDGSGPEEELAVRSVDTTLLAQSGLPNCFQHLSEG